MNITTCMPSAAGAILLCALAPNVIAAERIIQHFEVIEDAYLALLECTALGTCTVEEDDLALHMLQLKCHMLVRETGVRPDPRFPSSPECGEGHDITHIGEMAMEGDVRVNYQ